MTAIDPGTRSVQVSDPALEIGPDGRTLLQGRLVLYAAVMMVMAVVFVGGFLALWSQAPSTIFTGARRFVLSPSTVVVLVTYGVLLVILRSGPLTVGVLRGLELGAHVVLGLSFALLIPVGAHIDGMPPIVVFDVLLGMLLITIMRALVVPSSWQRTAAIGAVTTLFVLAAIVIWGDAFRVLAGSHGVLIGIFVNWIALAVTFSSLASGILYGLRREVRDARNLGQYTLLEPIGKGGMGVVYRARHAMLRRPTAIKLISAVGGTQILDRFEHEVQHMARLAHPNIVTVYDYGRTEDGRLYYAMELLDGADLERIVEADGPQPAARVVHVLVQACRALTSAHAAGLVHRDIKPANLFVCRDWGTADTLKVLDFGLVKDLRSTDVALTSEGAILGTPLYMAPEHWLRAEAVDPRCDLYSLGAVAYFLLTGRPVFDGNNPFEVMMQHMQTPPVPPSQLGRPVPEELEAIVLRCLAKQPADRYESAEALQADLEACGLAGSWRASDARAWWIAHEPGLRRAPDPAAVPHPTRRIAPRRQRHDSDGAVPHAATADTVLRSL